MFFVTGEVLQLSLNNRSKKFVGRQKIVAYIVLVTMTLRNSAYLPWVARDAIIREPLTLLGVVHFGIAFAWAVEAFVYPGTGRGTREDDTTEEL